MAVCAGHWDALPADGVATELLNLIHDAVQCSTGRAARVSAAFLTEAAVRELAAEGLCSRPVGGIAPGQEFEIIKRSSTLADASAPFGEGRGLGKRTVG